MKRGILTLLTFIVFCLPCEAGWFFHHSENVAEQKEKERREYAEAQLVQERQAKAHLQTTVLVLSVSCILALGIGTFVGCKTQHAVQQSHEQ
jgi:hypothetical protein